jgi:hypothetical protein
MNLFQEKMSISLAKQLAKQIGKEAFLKELKDNWKPVLDLSKSTDDIVDSSWGRIKQMKFESVFAVVGVTKEDIRKMIEELKNEAI